MLDRLALRPLLTTGGSGGLKSEAPTHAAGGHLEPSGSPPVNTRAADLGVVADALARLSVLAAELGDLLDALDVNPLVAGPAGCVAVDALVLPAGQG